VRYRIAPDGALENAYGGSNDVVTATVWFTLLVGIIFLVAGLRGGQRWLQFWGALTCVSCALYFMRGMLGFEAWLS
jgi:Na+-driven multidrug efflux pump